MTKVEREPDKRTPDAAASREARAAAALRENLRKRKEQQRQRATAPSEGAPSAAEGAAGDDPPT
jgi:hypothetical protein